MGTFYLMSGPSAAGKTTYAKSFTRKNNHIRYLSIDDFYGIYHGSTHQHSHEFRVWMNFFDAINIAMEDGVDVLVDTNSPTVVMRTQFLDWFGDFDRYVLIFINSTLQDCIARNSRRDRIVPDLELRRMYSQVEHPTLLEDRWTEIQCYNHVGEKFTQYQAPVGGPGVLQLRCPLTKSLDKHLKRVTAHTEIVVPTRYTRVHTKYDVVQIPIIIANDKSNHMTSLQICAFMYLNLLTGEVSYINLCGRGLLEHPDSVFNPGICDVVDSPELLKLDDRTFMMIRAIMVDGQVVDVADFK